MTNKSPEPPVKPVKPAPELDRYVPGDPIPIPQAVEKNTESTWALFSDVHDADEPDFQDTVPMPGLLDTPRKTGSS